MTSDRIKLSFIILMINFLSTSVYAQSPSPQYIQFSPAATKGALYLPDPEQYPNPQIAALNLHPISSRLSHISMKEMADRGFIILGMNSRCDNNETSCVSWEDIALDVKQGIEYLKKLPGITRILLLAGSSGAATLSFYQAVAENGVTFCQDTEKLTRCSAELKDLPPADGIIFRDPHLGNGVNALRSLNPAIINDPDIINNNAKPIIDQRLDPFSPDNGYQANGKSSYPDEFKKSYFKAQSDRMNRLIDIALNKLKQIEAGTHTYPDDDIFIIPRSDEARLVRLDRSIQNSTAEPRKLLKNNGTIEDCCIVKTVRPADLQPEGNQGFWSGTRILSVRSFLSNRAIRSRDSMDDIDYCSSNYSTICNVRNITVPIIVTTMGGHYHIRNSELIYENAASPDKDFIVIEGAVHGGTPCRACMPEGQVYDGRYDNSVTNNYDYVVNWINERFQKR